MRMASYWHLMHHILCSPLCSIYTFLDLRSTGVRSVVGQRFGEPGSVEGVARSLDDLAGEAQQLFCGT